MIRSVARALRHRLGDAGGFSLAEAVVATALLGLLGAVIGPTLSSNLNATSAVERRSRGVDEIRVAMARLDKEFRSAECVYEPVISTPGSSASGSRLRFKTRLNSGAYDVTYRVENGSLLRDAGGADEVVSTEFIDAGTAFTVHDLTRHRLDVTLHVQPDGKEVHTLESSTTGRNAWREC